MQLVKHVHACVSLAKDGGRIVVDPGAYSPDARDAVAAADAVLVTHDHVDHLDDALVADALAARPALRVYGPPSLAGRWPGREDQVVVVGAGQRLEVAGFEIEVFGELHAAIHADVPRAQNVGYLVDGRVYHPGDSYEVPAATVETLLLPTSGPWTRLADAVDYVRAVAPTRLVQIHELMLSEIGQQSTARFLSPAGLIDVALTILAPGESIDV